MLQNRVNPFGQLIETKARGTWMGNRGLLHNKQQQILRPFKLKAWITCVLEYKERRRPIMAPGQYTELFFLDEATAFAAGHRPCFECRRADALRFKLFWIKGNMDYGFDMKTPIGKIDEIIHTERINDDQEKLVVNAHFNSLPDGVFVQIDSEAYLLRNKRLFRWKPWGYDLDIPVPFEEMALVLTPTSILNAIRAGYILNTDK